MFSNTLQTLGDISSVELAGNWFDFFEKGYLVLQGCLAVRTHISFAVFPVPRCHSAEQSDAEGTL